MDEISVGATHSNTFFEPFIANFHNLDIFSSGIVKKKTVSLENFILGQKFSASMLKIFVLP